MIWIESTGRIEPPASLPDDYSRRPTVGKQHGASLQEVKDLLGRHSTLAMVMRYAHLSPEHLRKAVGRLDGLLTTASSSAHGANFERDVAEFQPTISP